MSSDNLFLTGVVEGFYGQAWAHETRLAYADYLALAGLNTYLYCPKSDPILRRRWPDRWPENQWLELKALADAYQQRELYWGVGISPFELYLNYGRRERTQLKDKMAYLGELEAPILAVLFDDMPGDLDSLASRQVEIVEDVQRWLPDVRLLVCPTYYSFDPVLERFFGAMPDNYWCDLGRQLPADVDIFWTGNEVCSKSITAEDIEQIIGALGRNVTLWDNYPVNDGKERCNHLYTTPLAQRSVEILPLLRGHLCNPMNQGTLSLPALSGLSALYGSGGLNHEVLCSVMGKDVWGALLQDAAAFEEDGLMGLGERACADMAAKYRQFEGAAALEIVDWLEGKYAFDPACLTG